GNAAVSGVFRLSPRNHLSGFHVSAVQQSVSFGDSHDSGKRGCICFFAHHLSQPLVSDADLHRRPAVCVAIRTHGFASSFIAGARALRLLHVHGRAGQPVLSRRDARFGATAGELTLCHEGNSGTLSIPCQNANHIDVLEVRNQLTHRPPRSLHRPMNGVREIGSKLGYSILTGPIASLMAANADEFTVDLSKCPSGYCRRSWTVRKLPRNRAES